MSVSTASQHWSWASTQNAYSCFFPPELISPVFLLLTCTAWLPSNLIAFPASIRAGGGCRSGGDGEQLHSSRCSFTQYLHLKGFEHKCRLCLQKMKADKFLSPDGLSSYETLKMKRCFLSSTACGLSFCLFWMLLVTYPCLMIRVTWHTNFLSLIVISVFPVSYFKIFALSDKSRTFISVWLSAILSFLSRLYCRCQFSQVLGLAGYTLHTFLLLRESGHGHDNVNREHPSQFECSPWCISCNLGFFLHHHLFIVRPYLRFLHIYNFWDLHSARLGNRDLLKHPKQM